MTIITTEVVQAACRAAEPGLYDGSIAAAVTPTLLPKPYTSAPEYVASRQRILTRQMSAALKAVAPLIIADDRAFVASLDATLLAQAADDIAFGLPALLAARADVATLIRREILRAQLLNGGDDHE